MRVEWLQFLLLLELDIFIIGFVILFALWLVYHYSVRSGYASLSYQATPMHEAILSRCTHIHNRYLGSPWLPTGDFLSILATFFRSHPHPYRREQVKSDDGALLNLDWLESESASEETPVLIVLPGITGHSKSGYLVHLVNGAYTHGWRVVVLVYPGTDLSKVATARFIRGHVPHDLEITIDHIKARLPQSTLYAVGYSMGAALLTKYLAHHGPKSKLSAVISCSNPFDVLYSVRSIASGYIKKLYNIHFLAALKKMYNNNIAVFREAFPHLTPEDVAAISSVEEYDTKLTMAHFGFKNLNEYYISLGCTDSVSDVSVPMLVAHAKDDPIVPLDAIPVDLLKQNPNIITMITDMGGHTGWLQGLNPMGPSWFDEVALEWIYNIHDYLQSQPVQKRAAGRKSAQMPSKAKASAHIQNGIDSDDQDEIDRDDDFILNGSRRSKKTKGLASPKTNGASHKSPANGSSKANAIASPKSPKRNGVAKAGRSTPASPKGRRVKHD
jgi:hypothetical protein